MGLFSHVGDIFKNAGTGNPAGITGLWGDISGANQQYNMAMQNLQFSRENFEWQKDTQNRIFKREDNAIKRRVRDLKRSGLSPVLAAGSGANAGAVVKTDAPKADVVRGPNLTEAAGMANNVMNLMKQKADISTTYAQKNLIDMQAAHEKAKKYGTVLSNKLGQYDVSNAKLTGVGNPKSFIGKIGKDFAGTATKSLPALLLQQLLQKALEEKKMPETKMHRRDNRH